MARSFTRESFLCFSRSPFQGAILWMTHSATPVQPHLRSEQTSEGAYLLAVAFAGALFASESGAAAGTVTAILFLMVLKLLKENR